MEQDEHCKELKYFKFRIFCQLAETERITHLSTIFHKQASNLSNGRLLSSTCLLYLVSCSLLHQFIVFHFYIMPVNHKLTFQDASG